ncbi:3-deoxy-D-manno-octulosonic acid transferase [Flavobacterium columnare NBRC 100251 = ATCC 23463]|uniref:3-deoxy-D-manno-octulosonic acid transferase n=2 Tax=Flavobacterium columnare TaxID=996 RepID=G8X591_FLACA|nr:glycosyltransferase N-terminal domain-containing protein [Flavobacterium columnare]AEW85502.1 3-deoxy-D-manno-octulosonic-acid transferase [Flavobacterium columnare ATCC 49512]AMO20098.1 3-deoxy-D-manno-octulosonic acid transferase [Flavobacterium columnare]ANO49298.1 3-deoxy-D-manno-octulosonic-acid transferase [Flavobacterium columnare]APT22720.1 3-deoxy-D-manno-octulosonic acid transferase [Flavobacterium columnare]AUX18048.1 3-deoxy-D-manno-octulosonic acid transferase [Flavobacterium c
MLFLYNTIIHFVQFFLNIIALLNPKIKLFVKGRKDVFNTLASKINPTDKTIWFHAASLGEYEQGLPVMEKIKENFSSYKIILTFFSPSGYEVKKNNTIADITIYLPLDTKANANLFLELVHPEKVFFIKYEFWPNYLNELGKRKIDTYLISGIFRKKQLFFKWYGGFYRNALKNFNYFFVQNDSSKELLKTIGFQNTIVSGDTRFDRVITILGRNNTLDFIKQFKDDKTTIVIGSSWPKDEDLLIPYINQSSDDVKFIIAPHNIKGGQISNIMSQINKSVVLHSEMSNKNLAQFNVFIIDTIGILTKIYSYADMAYVGGGFGNPGVHNILEPATFGVPVIIGPNYSHFAEATALVHQKGCISISDQTELIQAFNLLIQNEDERREKGHICQTFVQMNAGATQTITNTIFK